MATKEEIRIAVLNALRDGDWEWYTANGIILLLDGVTDGDGRAIFIYQGAIRILQPILDELENAKTIRSRQREGTEDKEYSLTEVSD